MRIKPFSTHIQTAVLIGMFSVGIGCGDTGQKQLRIPLSAVSTGPVFSVGAWQIALTRASLAFGPVYFCATAAASSSLCPTAVAELADVVSVDLLQTEPRPLGQIEAVTGTIHSVTFDFGIVWGNSDRRPVSFPATPDGHSAVFEGTATRGDARLRFTAAVDLVAQFQGSRVVQGALTQVDLSRAQSGSSSVIARFDPSAWFGQVDFDALWAARDAQSEVQITAASPAYNALVIGIGAVAPPRFEWRVPVSKSRSFSSLEER